ncbi:hypothetical protein SUDANB145_07387 (plasmid) [Streptomyces sp. enrichment culture]|uniref:hypothetical protein n=1 Tax=Streptomyces sp. enrichment culture TaxID=1795815 RepID=UPI003F5563AE
MRTPFTAGTGLHRYTRAHLVHDLEAAREEVLRLASIIRDRDTQVIEQGERIAQLEADHVDVGVEQQLRQRAEERADRLEQQLLAQAARLANEHAVTVPPMHRPVDDPDDTATAPRGISVRTLRDALNPSGV